jgi:hypothetical protein
MILKDLKSGRPVTNLTMMRKHLILRLSGRIKEMRDAGFKIKTVMVRANGKRYANYRLGDLSNLGKSHQWVIKKAMKGG